MCRAAVAALFALLPWFVPIAVAFGEEIVPVEVSGEAISGAGGEIRALDAAFVSAVWRVLNLELGAEPLRRHEPLLRREVLTRARGFVVSYTVRHRQVGDARVHLELTVRVDRDKLRRRIAALGVATTKGSRPPPSARPKVALLLAANLGDQVEATFGERGGDGGTAGAAFAREVRELGFEQVSVIGRPIPVSRESGAELLLGDRAAMELAVNAGAQGAFVVALEGRWDGAIRGTQLVGAATRARLRLLDAVAGRVVAQASVAEAGYGQRLQEALADAVENVVAAAVREVVPAVNTYWPRSDFGAGSLVAVRGASRWSTVVAISRQLRATPGIEQVWTSRLRRGELVLAVEPRVDPNRLVGIVQGATLPAGQLAVRADARGAVVQITGDDVAL